VKNLDFQSIESDVRRIPVIKLAQTITDVKI